MGQLTVAGKTRNVKLDVAVVPAGSNLSVSTHAAFKMTDFAIKPPTAMLGMIRSGDAVTVNVTWQLVQRQAEAGAGRWRRRGPGRGAGGAGRGAMIRRPEAVRRRIKGGVVPERHDTMRLGRIGLVRGLELAMVMGVVAGCSDASAPPTRTSGGEGGQAVVASAIVGQEAQKAPVDWVVGRQSQVLLEGTTNVSSWTSRSQQVSGMIPLDADLAALDAMFDKAPPPGTARAGPAVSQVQLGLAASVPAEVVIPVMSVRGENAGMERDLHAALKAPQHLSIKYRFQKITSAQAAWDADNHAPMLMLHVQGTLEMAGVIRPLPIDLQVIRTGTGEFWAHAQTQIKMTDYQVTPPTALFGLIHANNEVSVVFDLQLGVKGRKS